MSLLLSASVLDNKAAPRFRYCSLRLATFRNRRGIQLLRLWLLFYFYGDETCKKRAGLIHGADADVSPLFCKKHRNAGMDVT
jgi:hypothetical protein